MILNLMRLGADYRERVSPGEFLATHLKSNETYQSFLEELRQETQKQVAFVSSRKFAFEKSRPFAGPLPALKNFQSLDAKSIDLGSQCTPLPPPAAALYH
jgi:hypothetical protein